MNVPHRRLLYYSEIAAIHGALPIIMGKVGLQETNSSQSLLEVMCVYLSLSNGIDAVWENWVKHS